MTEYQVQTGTYMKELCFEKAFANSPYFLDNTFLQQPTVLRKEVSENIIYLRQHFFKSKNVTFLFLFLFFFRVRREQLGRLSGEKRR